MHCDFCVKKKPGVFAGDNAEMRRLRRNYCNRYLYLMLRLSSLLVFFMVCSSARLLAQDDEPKTIRVRKESNLAKAQFDNTEMRLFVIDRFGNPRDNEILAYTLHVKTKRGVQAFKGGSNALTGEMISYLKKQKEASKIFFTDITALDEFEHPVKLPDVIEVWFPDCKNCDPAKRK
jgi:hypothetical protein